MTEMIIIRLCQKAVHRINETKKHIEEGRGGRRWKTNLAVLSRGRIVRVDTPVTSRKMPQRPALPFSSKRKYVHFPESGECSTLQLTEWTYSLLQ